MPTQDTTTSDTPDNTPDWAKRQGQQTANELMLKRYRDSEIVVALAGYGIPEARTPSYLRVARKHVVALRRKQALIGMAFGAPFFFGGLALTAFGYHGALNGGSFYIFWGAILFGGIRFFSALFAYLNAGHES